MSLKSLCANVDANTLVLIGTLGEKDSQEPTIKKTKAPCKNHLSVFAQAFLDLYSLVTRKKKQNGAGKPD